MSATKQPHRSTFLLEMALDKERLKARVAERVRLYREARHMTQPQLANKLGLSMRQYQRLEAGENMPRWATLERIADLLDVSTAQLIAAEEEEATLQEAEASNDVILAAVQDLHRRIDGLEAQLRERPDARKRKQANGRQG